MPIVFAPKYIISKDFRPERILLAKLLGFAAQNGSGTKQDISGQTGIPTGEKSGKVEPMIEYALGMGLITADKNQKGVFQLGLSPVGQVIFNEDRFLNEPHTLWLLHLLLCRPRVDFPLLGVVDPWFALFADSVFRLGQCFQRQDLTKLLSERYPEKKSKKFQDSESDYINSVAGMVINSYLENNSFGSIAVLRQRADDAAYVERCAAPTDKSYFPIYTAYLYLLWDDLFAGEHQIALDRLAEESRCFAVMGWGDTAIYRWLEWMVDERLIQLDRYTGAAMLLRLSSTQHVVGRLYSELI
jgi:hypothetical protein